MASAMAGASQLIFFEGGPDGYVNIERRQFPCGGVMVDISVMLRDAPAAAGPGASVITVAPSSSGPTATHGQSDDASMGSSNASGDIVMGDGDAGSSLPLVDSDAEPLAPQEPLRQRFRRWRSYALAVEEEPPTRRRRWESGVLRRGRDIIFVD